jgi:hypothetical protein
MRDKMMLSAPGASKHNFSPVTTGFHLHRYHEAPSAALQAYDLLLAPAGALLQHIGLLLLLLAAPKLQKPYPKYMLSTNRVGLKPTSTANGSAKKIRPMGHRNTCRH